MADPIQRPRETWFVTNVTNNSIRITDIPSMPVIKAGQRIDLLIYASLSVARSSTTISGYISNGSLSSEEYLHTHDDRAEVIHGHVLTDLTDVTATTAELTQLTDGSNADALHTHAGGGGGGTSAHNDISGLNDGDYIHLTSAEKISFNLNTSKKHEELHTIASHTDTNATGDELNTLTDGSNADALHTHAVGGGGLLPCHNDLPGLNIGDCIHLTSAEKISFNLNTSKRHEELHTIASHTDTNATGAELNILTDGSNADALHTHTSISHPDHNDLNGLNVGDYKHLTSTQYTTLTNGSIADSLHKHTASFIDTDTTYFDGALTSADDTSQKAFDTLDDIVGLLVPEQPTAFPSSSLSVESIGDSPKVCSGAIPDNTGSGSIGSQTDSVTRVVSTIVSSSTIQDSGPGNSGTVTSVVNNSSAGLRVMTTGNDNGTYGSLVISNNVDYPLSTPGFWMSFDVSINNILTPLGWNRFKITHSVAGDTSDVYFIYDNLNSLPVVSGATVTQNSASNTSYSSGILHYGAGSVMNMNTISMTNLSGYTYYGGADVITIDDAGNGIVGGSETKSFADLGYSTPVAINQTGPIVFPNNQTVTLDGSNIHAEDNIRYRGRNVVNFGIYTTISSPNILYINGLIPGHNSGNIDEDSIYIDDSELGTSPNGNNAERINTLDGDNPAETFAGTSSDWVASATLDAHDAAIVGGLLSNNTTNYSTGYLPAGGDNLSGQNANQYVAFWFSRTPVSKFDIQITAPNGVAGCWVELAGVSDTYTVSTNGWWDMSIAYGGSGNPGDTGLNNNGSLGVSLGTVMPLNTSISNQRYTCTFGGLSSSTATNNNIIVRFKLTSGQSITSLSFRGASN